MCNKCVVEVFSSAGVENVLMVLSVLFLDSKKRRF